MTLHADVSEVAHMTVTIPDHVLFQRLDGEAVILDVQTGGYFGLNGVGTFVWERLAEGLDTRAVIDALCEQYEVDQATASADAQTFFSALHQQKLIEIHG